MILFNKIISAIKKYNLVRFLIYSGFVVFIFFETTKEATKAANSASPDPTPSFKSSTNESNDIKFLGL